MFFEVGAKSDSILLESSSIAVESAPAHGRTDVAAQRATRRQRPLEVFYGASSAARSLEICSATASPIADMQVSGVASLVATHCDDVPGEICRRCKCSGCSRPAAPSFKATGLPLFGARESVSVP